MLEGLLKWDSNLLMACVVSQLRVPYDPTMSGKLGYSLNTLLSRILVLANLLTNPLAPPEPSRQNPLTRILSQNPLTANDVEFWGSAVFPYCEWAGAVSTVTSSVCYGNML